MWCPYSPNERLQSLKRRPAGEAETSASVFIIVEFNSKIIGYQLRCHYAVAPVGLKVT
jgi:hypothetical protein